MKVLLSHSAAENIVLGRGGGRTKSLRTVLVLMVMGKALHKVWCFTRISSSLLKLAHFSCPIWRSLVATQHYFYAICVFSETHIFFVQYFGPFKISRPIRCIIRNFPWTASLNDTMTSDHGVHFGVRVRDLPDFCSGFDNNKLYVLYRIIPSPRTRFNVTVEPAWWNRQFFTKTYDSNNILFSGITLIRHQRLVHWQLITLSGIFF